MHSHTSLDFTSAPAAINPRTVCPSTLAQWCGTACERDWGNKCIHYQEWKIYGSKRFRKYGRFSWIPYPSVLRTVSVLAVFIRQTLYIFRIHMCSGSNQCFHDRCVSMSGGAMEKGTRVNQLDISRTERETLKKCWPVNTEPAIACDRCQYTEMIFQANIAYLKALFTYVSTEQSNTAALIDVFTRFALRIAYLFNIHICPGSNQYVQNKRITRSDCSPSKRALSTSTTWKHWKMQEQLIHHPVSIA